MPNRKCVNPRIIEIDYDETADEPTGRRCARNILSVMAEELANKDGRVSDNYELSDKYFKRYPDSTWHEYLFHWVEYVYRDNANGKTYFKLSKHIL